MPRKSSIKSLPDPVLNQVNRLLADGAWTIDQVVEYLAEAGHPRARSSVGRYKQHIDKVADKLRRSREMADALVREIGPGATEGKTGRLLVEILQNLAFEFLLKRTDDDDPDADEFAAKDFAHLGKALKDMASAQKIDLDREIKIRREVADKVVAQLDEAAKEAQAAGEKGLSAKRVAQLRRDFLGVRDRTGA